MPADKPVAPAGAVIDELMGDDTSAAAPAVDAAPAAAPAVDAAPAAAPADSAAPAPAVDAAPVAPAPVAEVQTFTASASRDTTLEVMAENYGVSVDDLLMVNPDLTRDSLVKEGQFVLIPIPAE